MNTPSSHLVLGLMSGTSADGIDVALVNITERPGHSRGIFAAKLENFVTVPFPAKVRQAILRLADGGETTTAELSQLNFLLGEMFAHAALKACRRFRVSPKRIALTGSHGQTIYHQGKPRAFLGRPVASTLQIGEPAVIAERTGITTVADFRTADVAAGGQGAPLVPYVDYLLYGHTRRGCAVLNIGGIANVTVIPPRNPVRGRRGARPAQVFAFDTGPGNMVIDALVRHFTRGRQNFDRDARIAQCGRLLPALLDSALRQPYLRQPPPKSAGREQFGEAYAQRWLAWGRKHKSHPEDLIRTTTVFTALSILDAFHRWILPRARIEQLIASGGGAHNPLLMAQIQAGLRGVQIIPSSLFGLPEDAKEAFAFAVLAYETYCGRPANLPGATGARHPVILGKVCRPKN